MSNQLLKDAYQRKYYDVEVECHLVATVMKRVYVDEFASHVDTHLDCEHLDRYHNIIAEEVGADEFHNNNRLFYQMDRTIRMQRRDSGYSSTGTTPAYWAFWSTVQNTIRQWFTIHK